MKIAIVKLSAMGDIIHGAIILQFLKKKFPNIEIDWVVEEVFASLLENNSRIDTLITLPLMQIKKEKNFKLLKESVQKLRNQKRYDYILDLQGNIKSAIVSRLLGKPVVGYDKYSLREKPAALLYHQKYAISYGMNVIWRSVGLMEKCFGMQLEIECILEKKPLLEFDSIALSKAMQLWGEHDEKILFFVGASWPSKIYPASLMSEVIVGLSKKVVIVWGSEAEEQLAKEIADNAQGLVTIMPRLSIPELMAVVSLSDIVVGGDTGPVHMAWALNRPSLTIFGPTPSFRNTFVTPINRVIDSGAKIDPYHLNKDDFCINEIKPSRIVAHVNALLGY
jgi:heptosyltransferase I